MTVRLMALLALVGGGAAGCGEIPAPSPAPAPVTYAVGVTTRDLDDTSRPTPANGTAPSSPDRHLVTEVWYPTAPSVTSNDGGSDAGAGPVRDARPDHTAAHPLVLFVHGSSGSRLAYTWLTVALASAGYVVAAADFPLTAFNTEGGESDRHVDDQAGDLVFLANQFAAAARDPRDAFAGAVDASGYAVAGHSTGGTVALVAAFAPDAHDPRLRGAVALAPCACFFGDGFFRTRAVPLLVVAGTDDRYVPIATNGARAYALASAPRTLATLVGGNHLFFTDAPLSDGTAATPTTSEDDIAVALRRYGGGTACTPAPPPGTDPPMSADDQHAYTVALTRAFLDDVLRAQPGRFAALVANPGSNPGSNLGPGVRIAHE